MEIKKYSVLVFSLFVFLVVESAYATGLPSMEIEGLFILNIPILIIALIINFFIVRRSKNKKLWFLLPLIFVAVIFLLIVIVFVGVDVYIKYSHGMLF
jgi:hypothetical protein